MNKIVHLKLEQLKPPAFDARLTPNDEADKELEDSIREIGIKFPLLVKKEGDDFEIIAGNRRYNAAGKVGLPSVPCIIEKVTGALADKIKLHENMKRLDLSHVDQAYTFAYLIKEYNMTETEIASLIKKSIGYVSQHLSLLDTDPVILSAVQGGRINFSVARELFACQDPDEQKRLCLYIEETGASTEIVKQWVRESNRETENFEHDHKLEQQTYPSTEPQIPHYPCATCNTLTKYDLIRTIRMCPDCFKLFNLELEQGRQKERIKLTTKGYPDNS